MLIMPATSLCAPQWALGLMLGPPIIAGGFHHANWTQHPLSGKPAAVRYDESMCRAGAVYILRRGGPFLALHLWAALLALSLVMMAVYPTLIAPLFNDFKSLPQGSLRCDNAASAWCACCLIVSVYACRLGAAAQDAN